MCRRTANRGARAHGHRTPGARSFIALIAVVASAVAPGASAQPLRRSIEPFRVETPAGLPFVNPFSGGLAQPRIGLRDVTGHELPDLLTLNPGGELRLYRNEGALRFRRVLPSPYDSLEVFGWFRFVDLDDDGAAELLTAGPRSEVMVFDNDGSDRQPAFPAVPHALRTAGGDTIRTQRETVPSFVDIDADDDLDLFSGNLDGSISFYENVGNAAAPSYVFRTDRFMGILVVGGRAAPPREPPALAARHGASVLDFADLDGDADLDLLFGDAFTRKLLLFLNTGTPTAPSFGMDRLDTAFQGMGDDVESEGFNQPAVADLDGDGDLDVVVSSLSPSTLDRPLTLFENVGTVTAPVMRRRGLDLTSELDVGTYAAPAWIDDTQRRGLLVGSTSGRITYFEVASESPTVLRERASYAVPGLFQTAPAAGDLDGDGIAEIAIGEAFGSISFYRFDGDRLERFGDTFLLNRNASPQLVDADGDGDLDLIAGAENGRVSYFTNTGTPSTPRFERASTPEPFAGLDVGSDAAPRFFDLDGDGDLDAVLGSRTGGASERRDSVRFLLRTDGGWSTDPRWPTIVEARNPVPLVLRRPEGLVLLVGDQAGGVRAFIDGGNWLGIPGVPHSSAPSLAAHLDRGLLTVFATAVPTARRVLVTDLLGRTVAAPTLAPGAARLTVPVGQSAPLLVRLGEAAVLVGPGE